MLDTADPVSNLRDLRDSIDNIDAAIIHLLAERFRCTQAVGKLKAQHRLPSRDPEEKPSRSTVCGISLSASSTQILPRSSSPLSFVKSFAITNRFRAQSPTWIRPIAAYSGKE
jgi:monofunctional chorismate mutase